LFDRTGVALARYPEPAAFVGTSYYDSELLTRTRDGSGSTFEANGLDGKRRFYAYTLVGEETQPALLAVGLPESSLFGEANANLRRGLAFLAGVAVIAIIFASMFGDFFLVRRLRSVVAASRRLAGGDLKARSGLTIQYGELGSLSHSFDRMADAIEKRDSNNLEIAESLEKKVRQLDALHGVFSKITETLHTEDVVRSALTEAAQLVNAEVTVLRLIKGTELEVAGFVSNNPAIELDLQPVTVGEGLIGTVAESAKTMRAERNVEDQMQAGQGIAGAQSGIAVPVMIHGTVLGTLGCWALRPSAFSIDDERLLEMLATQIAAAITAATSREDSERLARIDSLTGLPNRLQLSEDEAAVERTAADQGLAVLMIDIDWFKRVNDVYGHLLGDRVLRQVGTILRQVLRSTDHVYRFGGEEFLVVAACSSEAESLALAERLRAAVDQSVILRRADETGIHVTVSVGVATLKSPTHKLVEAIDMADQALYAAKNKGRNQSALWSTETSQSAAA
jgi:diguanylate cyclase (GGDEF)-like protein